MNKNKESTPQGIHVVAKPIGPVCNLDCEYCLYMFGNNTQRNNRVSE